MILIIDIFQELFLILSLIAEFEATFQQFLFMNFEENVGYDQKIYQPNYITHISFLF